MKNKPKSSLLLEVLVIQHTPSGDAAERMTDGSASGLRRMPTQARSREKVERALVAAQELIEREGVGSLTLPRVAKEADISVGALYQYLPDREALVTALTTMYHQRHETRLDEIIEAVQATETKDPLGEVLRAIANVYRENKQALTLRSELQAAADPQLTRGHKLRMVEKVESILLTYRLVEEEQANLTARTIFFAADGVMHEAFTLDAEGDPNVLAELETMLGEYIGLRANW